MSNPFSQDENVENIENVETEEKTDETVEQVETDENSELQKKYDELNNQYLRLAADFDNYRKRQAQERESLLKYGAENTLKKIIDVLDNFDRGSKAIESVEDCENVEEQKYDTLNQQYIRLAADFDNYRKRQEHEREELLKFGTENALKKMLEVLDNFERGKKALENVEDCEKVKESFNLVHKQLLDVLSKVGLETIDAEGKEFDPNFHEAVMRTPTSEYGENTVIAELQKGYKLEDRVLRPSLVNVATAE